MANVRSKATCCAALVAGVFLSGHVRAGESGRPLAARIAMPAFAASNIVVPQSRSFVVRPGARAVRITEVTVGAVVVERVATTTMDISLANPAARALEAELLVPVPEGAIVRSFDFHGAQPEPTARLLPHDEAKRTYEAIVSKSRDPALLEFAGNAMVRSSVFPVPARGTQKVRFTYEHLLPREGRRIEYVIPRTESLELSGVPWHVTVKLHSRTPISTVYSPTHRLDVVRRSPGEVSARIARDAETEPGPFRLYALLDGEDIAASLLAYPEAGGGYFLLLAAPPATLRADRTIRREVTLVLDRSGSMAGEKMEQARAAALQVVEGLEPGEAFNIIDFSSTVSLFSPRPVERTRDTVADARAYIRAIRPRGGTNMHDALIEAVRQPAPESGGRLPLVLLLTDGLPTVGVTRETDLRDSARRANRHGRRIFTFGVGYDVNAPLLSGLAKATRATSTFVLPEEDVEVKVAGVFERLKGPVLAEPVLETLGPGGGLTTRVVRDVMPSTLPDVFKGDQLVILGKYTGDGPLRFRLRGNYLGRERSFEFGLSVANATRHGRSFVPRLWASRRIGILVEAIRQAGAEHAARPRTRGPEPLDPRLKELVDEIVRLSTEFGILTEYTAFLAREGTPLDRDEILRRASGNFQRRAIHTRGGKGAVNQELNSGFLVSQFGLNRKNKMVDQEMRPVEFSTIQQVNDRAFFKKGNRWMDSRLLTSSRAKNRQAKAESPGGSGQAGTSGAAGVQAARRVEFGSGEYYKLAERLRSEGRNGILALPGELELMMDRQRVVVTAPPAAPRVEAMGRLREAPAEPAQKAKVSY